MFTGLVQDQGTIAERISGDSACQLRIRTGLDPRHCEVGASVAVAGVCLTVERFTSGVFEVTAAFETLARTALGQRQPGDRVNLEPSLRAGDPLGGHFVTGHVDGVGTVATVVPRGDARELTIAIPPELRPMIAAKGSITVDGVSLTVNAVDDQGFSVGLIPHTLAVTTLSELGPGDAVNLEVDVLARYLARLLATRVSEASQHHGGPA